MKLRRVCLPLAAVPLLGGVLLASCGRTSEQAAGDVRTHHTAAPHDHAVAAVAPALASDMSVYQLESEWTDQHGRTRRLAELSGRPQAVAMVYTHCGSACPRIVGDLKQLEAEFPELGLVLVSIDPDRDTPGRLLEFAHGSGLGERWTLLNGADGALMELAAVLGVRYRRVSETEFVHSNLITVLDATGNIAYRQEALGEVAGTAAALRHWYR
jgi:protein SCO1/2